MCIFKNKWRDFEPTKKYLSVIGGLTSVAKLAIYIKKIKYISDKKDYWQTPIETLIRGKGDCEDFARFTLDMLHRILNIKGARFVIHSGYNKKLWGNKIWNIKCHAITVFPYRDKLAVFSNNELHTGVDSFEDAGKILFVNGLKYQEIRNDKGKVLKRKWKLFGVF